MYDYAVLQELENEQSEEIVMKRLLTHISAKGVNLTDYEYEKFIGVPEELKDSFSLSFERYANKLGLSVLVIAVKRL